MSQAKLLYGIDVLEGLKTLANDSVHCVVTSPPYWGLRDYGVKGQIGLEKTPEEFINKMTEIFRHVRRTLRKDGTLWMNMGDSYIGGGRGGSAESGDKQQSNRGSMDLSPTGKINGMKAKDLCGIPWMLAFALRADGWYLRSEIIWSKPNPMPESVTDRPTKAHETIFLLAKSSKYFYDSVAIREDAKDWGTRDRTGQTAFTEGVMPGGQPHSGCKNINFAERGRNKRSVWEIATQPYPEAHFATFPSEIPKLCILAGTSAHGACAACGAPWIRVVEKTRSLESNGAKANVPSGWDTGKGDHRAKASRYPNGKGVATNQARAKHDVRDGPCVSTKTTGWAPSCKCQQGGVRNPCVVLDPFSGSATTGEVAIGLGRNYIGIDLNADYLKLAKKRLGLFL